MTENRTVIRELRISIGSSHVDESVLTAEIKKFWLEKFDFKITVDVEETFVTFLHGQFFSCTDLSAVEECSSTNFRHRCSSGRLWPEKCDFKITVGVYKTFVTFFYMDNSLCVLTMYPMLNSVPSKMSGIDVQAEEIGIDELLRKYYPS